MGFFGELFSDIGDWCKEAFGSVSNALSAAITGIAAGLAVLFPPLSPIIATVATIASGIAQTLGMIGKEETSEELGMKASQALETRDLKPENFDSYKAYLNEVRKETIDMEKLNSLPLAEKNGYQLVGSRILGNAIGEELGIELTDEFLKMSGKMDLSPQTTLTMIESFKKHGSTSMQDMTDYIKETLPADKVKACSDAMKEAIKAENPDASNKDISAQIDAWEKSINSPEN